MLDFFIVLCFFFFSSRRRHTRSKRDWSSDVCSSDLTPMMAARLLKDPRRVRHGRFYQASERAYERVIEYYGRTLKWVLKHQPATLLATVAALVLTVFLYMIVPKGFFPVQDTGVILG